MAAHVKTGQPGPQLLPLKKAAEVPGLTIWAMRSRVWAGNIPVVRFSATRSDIAQWYDEKLTARELPE